MNALQIILLFRGLWFAHCSLLDGKLKVWKDLERLKEVQLLLRECFQQIADKYKHAHNQDNFVILIPVFSENDVPIRPFSMPTFYINTKAEHIHWSNVQRGNIYIVISSDPVPEILKKIPWTENTFFAVYTAGTNEALALFRDFWAEGVVNVIALNVQQQSIGILSYYPFTSKHCGIVTEVVELGIWNRTSGIPGNLFPDKVHNLKKCHLKILLLNRPPAVMVNPETGKIAGAEVEILKYVTEVMNATPDFDFLHDQPWTKIINDQSTNILMHALEERHCHIVAGSLMYTSSVSTSSEAIDYLESLCVTFAVPQITKKFSFKYTYIILPQNGLMVIATALIALIVIYDLKCYYNPLSISITSSVAMVASPLIGGTFKPKNSQKIRVLLSLWLWTCFVFWKLYEAFVSSSIIVPQPEHQMETLDEVLESDLTIIGETFLINEILLGYSEQKKLPKISRSKSFVEDAIFQLGLSKNLAYLGTKSNIRYTISLHPDTLDKVHILENCATKYSPVFQTAKYSPYKKALSKGIRALSESGIIRKLFRGFNEEVVKRVQKYANDSAISPLSLIELSGAFCALGTGLLLASIVFLGEIFYGHYGKKYKKRQH